MSNMNRGPGGGPKRRIRTMYQTIGNELVVRRNRSKKPLPADWRELLADTVRTVCGHPPKHFYNALTPPGLRFIMPPHATIALGSRPTGIITFSLDLDPTTAYYQRRAIDWALSRCDVNIWPVAKPELRYKDGECFVNTGLYLQDGLQDGSNHLFNPYRLEGVPDINWRHLRQYTAHHAKAEFLGIRTACESPCSCQQKLPELWPLGWEMHY